ncbi:MAG: AI-2E family transporter, partial [Chloroflexi bacterium]|nr:AI-2E family transporter [Chloroflexota bacterium]
MAHATTPRLQAPTPRVALLIFTVVVIGVVLYMARGALGPFLLGLVLIYVLDPAVQFLARRRVPRALAVLIVYAVAIFAVVEGLAFLLGPVVEQVGAFITQLPQFLGALDAQIQRLTEIYRSLELPAPVREAIDGALADLDDQAGGFDPGTLLPVVRSIFSAFGAVFGLLLIPVWAFYLLKDRTQLQAAFDQALPAGWRRDTWAVLRIIERVMGRYLRALFILGLLVGVATFAGLMILGLVIDERFFQFAVLLAVIAGLAELLPIIGPILSAIPTLLLAVTIS